MSWNSTSRNLLLYCCHTLFLFGLLLHTQSASAFHIECPPDTTVSCDAEIWDLSGFGTAYVYGYGTPEPAGDPISVHYDLNDCGSGTIVRTWVAYDYGNHPHYCSQTIYVGGGSSGVHIDWPPNYDIHDCDPMTDPEDLPPPFDMPVVTDYGGSCESQIMIGYEDKVFDINPPACKKILREWTVIDWCQYDPNDYHPTGIWEYTQVIKISPENPPTIHCPDDLTVSAGPDCGGTYVHIPPATGMSDCGADVIITNHSPFADNNGADASGHYPFGTTKVVFTASDGCGGKITCSMYVTIKDMKAPTPICYYGISVSLMQMDDGYYMDLRPDFFDKGSFDNCTPDDKLVFDIEPKRVDCSNIGQTPVKVFVTDLDGNRAWCNTVVNVQDNNGICPPTNGLIEGAVFTPQGVMIEGVDVALMEPDEHTATGTDGHYAFASIPFGHQYEVKPQLNSDHTEGISSLDLVILLKHILGIERLVSPYQHLAADIDGSGHVSVNDLLDLKDIVLRNYYELPTETSWRFVDATFDFADQEEPLSEPIPESYTISSFDSDMHNLNFVGVKVGDLTGDYVGEDGFIQDEMRTADVPLIIQTRKPGYTKGETIEFDILVDGSREALQAIQYTLRFDPAMLSFVDVVDATPDEVESSVYGLAKLADGLISGLWFDVEPATDRMQLARITFQALEDLDVADILDLYSKPTRAAAYGLDGREAGVILEFESQPSTSHAGNVGYGDFEVGANYPNPFSRETTIPITLGKSSTIKIEIYDAAGRSVFMRRFDGKAGRNDLVINTEGLVEKGILLCKVRAGDAVSTIRMLSLK